MNCPECKEELEKRSGLQALVQICTKCNRQFVVCLGKLVPIEKFHQTSKEFNS
jgi:ribosomal protein L37AE/L43A